MAWRLTSRFISRRLLLTFALTLGLAVALLFVLPTAMALAQGPETDAFPEYRKLGSLGARVPVWIVAQLHLYFAAFILGVPMFSVLLELIGIWKKDDRYDRLAQEFAKLLVTATAITALFGAVLLILIASLYPRLFNYLAGIFSPAFAFYGLLFFAESFTMYIYWYSWNRMKRRVDGRQSTPLWAFCSTCGAPSFSW